MSTRIMIGNHNSNNKKHLFLRITKKSPTNIIFQTENEHYVLDNNELNTKRENKNQQRTLWG